MLTGRYLVLIEDDAIMGHSLVQRLELEGAEVTWVKQAVRGIAAVRTPRRPVDAVICDIRLPDGSGEEIFATVSRRIAPPPFLFITGQGEIDQAVRLLRAGGADYMTKPFDMSAFLRRLVQILRPYPGAGLPPQTGISPLARQVDSLVADFARHDGPVLIRGARGLGKERLARRIHALSDRRSSAFVVANAFRDSVSADRLRAAIGTVRDGTLFVNGVGRLDGAAQHCLIDALGQASFRLIAACGTRIDEKVAAGGFRSDLLYALLAHEIVVPPLAQRGEDAAWLAGQMFEALNVRREAPLRGISELTLAAIHDHDWPGNGRELRSRLLRAMEVVTGDWIYPADVFPELNEHAREVRPLSEARDLAERHQIIRALEHTGGQVAEAARLLKVSRTTLWEKMHKLGL
ncbi:sigma-54-dependent transcriptional regulator [Roseivivax isoporae]|uniref:Fis family transcriptional regulator n=1 Tax=Roseivivax isoporae LMG 25204 TaxID=1449351 RepID=X7F2R4_9RHOB|nr:response regulator [Roseivivax isoporae]ETX27060.1 Fis family transcriptional regulator [Roseivivax isoporae LMG 25204]